MRGVGLDPQRIREAKRDDLDTWIELHIEQGPILEADGLQVGVVDAITAIRHYVVELRGRSDHAGARPMEGRLDPMAGFAEVVTAVIGVALESGPPAVTTVGQVEVEPNLPSAVPDRVTFTLDSRHPDQKAVNAQHARQEQLMREIAERRGLQISWTKPLDLPASPSDPTVVAELERAAADKASLIAGCTAGRDTTLRTSPGSRRRRWCSRVARTAVATRRRSSHPSRTRWPRFACWRRRCAGSPIDAEPASEGCPGDTGRRMYSDRVGIDDVEPYFGQKRDRLQGAQPDQLLVAGLERQGVEDTVELARVHRVELRVEEAAGESRRAGARFAR